MTAAPAVARVNSLEQLRSHFSQWYFDFDWQAMELCLCAVIAHYAAKETQAIWPFIIGAPRTGKTEAVIRSFAALPQVYSAGDLTPKALMSANSHKGLLETLNEQGKKIILFKDFTTMLGKRIEDAQEVMSAFREIADGDYSRWTGNGQVPPWEGKLTIIGGVTPAIEKHRALLEALGPRFLFIRWPTPPAREVGRRAVQQIDNEVAIRKRAQELVKEILMGAQGIHLPPLAPGHLETILDFCEAFVWLRQPVEWDFKHHYIERTQEKEGAGAIAKHLDLIARSRAALWGRTETNADDIELARRVALDSLPSGRLVVFQLLMEGATGIKELAVRAHMDYQAARNIVRELRAIGMLSQSDDDEVLTLELGNMARSLF
jgi:hypothetical protein